MEILVTYKNKKYKYMKINQITTWVDEANKLVPVRLHTTLREKAINLGVNSSLFLSENITINTSIDSVKKEKSKKNKLTTQGLNPFKYRS